MVVELARLLEATASLSERIDNADMDQLLQLIQLRDETTAFLQPYAGRLSNEEKQLIRDINSYDDVILRRMNELKEQASAELASLKKAAIQKNAYSSAYSVGSYFFDKRK